MKNKKMYYVIPIFILAMAMVGFYAVQPVKSLTMDVNPSIEIVANRLDRVMEINSLNEDAEELLKDFKPKDKNLENTVNDLVDLMVLTGHIKGGKDNFVMLTVEDTSMDRKLVEKVNKAIAAMLENKQIEATVLNQMIAKNEKGEKQTGVQLAAQRLNEIDDNLTKEEIEKMTVKELIKYSRNNNIEIENLFKILDENGQNAKQSNSIISKKKAEEIALGKTNGEISKIELSDFNGDEPEYKIEILRKDGKYEMEIDAYTGKIKEFEKEELFLNKEQNKAKDASKKTKKSLNTKISSYQAKKIALDKVGGGKVTDFESDGDEYEIEIKFNGKEYEIEINAYSGNIIEFEVDDDDEASTKKAKNSRISSEKARNIALNLAGGGTITDFESDDDEYEIEIKFNGKEYEIEINAYTGEIIEFEVD